MYVCMYERLGGLDQSGNRFVSFVRARTAVCEVMMDFKSHSLLFPFPSSPRDFFPLPFPPSPNPPIQQ